MYNRIGMKFDYNKDKDLWLKEIRGVGFEEVIETIESKGVLDDVEHFNKVKYPNQRIFVIELKHHVYMIPYVIDKKRKVKFLKTIYANRKLKKVYLKNE